jgi:undecaprenyl-diphosphatase
MTAEPRDRKAQAPRRQRICGVTLSLGAVGCLEHLARYDAAAFSTINHALASSRFDALMQWASDGVVLVSVWTAVCAYWLLSVGSWRRRGLLLMALAVLIALTDGSGNAVKKVVQRTRPCRVVADARIVTHCPDSPSFPSNHAANNFAMAAFVATCQPRLGLITLPLAALVAYSRVHLGVHYPLDVLTGAIAGALLGFAAGAVMRRFAPPAAPSLSQGDA